MLTNILLLTVLGTVRNLSYARSSHIWPFLLGWFTVARFCVCSNHRGCEAPELQCWSRLRKYAYGQGIYPRRPPLRLRLQRSGHWPGLLIQVKDPPEDLDRPGGRPNVLSILQAGVEPCEVRHRPFRIVKTFASFDNESPRHHERVLELGVEFKGRPDSRQISS